MRGLVLGNRPFDTSVRVLGAVTGAALAIAVVAGYELSRSSDEADVQALVAGSPPLLSKAAFQAKVGVRITRVSVTGDGGLLDLRFQVLDPRAAASIHDASTPPQLVDESTGVVVSQLLMGHMHTGKMNPGQTYYLLFNNPGNLVRRGGSVTVQLGSARLADVAVE